MKIFYGSRTKIVPFRFGQMLQKDSHFSIVDIATNERIGHRPTRVEVVRI